MQHHRPLAAALDVVLGLGQHAGQGGELGLAARQGLAVGQRAVAHVPVGPVRADRGKAGLQVAVAGQEQGGGERQLVAAPAGVELDTGRSGEPTYELQSLMRRSYAVFWLKKQK